MSMLTPEPGLVLWMTISFGIVVFILVKFGFPIILGMLDKRQAFIENSLSEAREARLALEKVKEKSEELLTQTRREQTQIIEAATQLKDEILSEAKIKAHTEADKIIAEAHRQIEKEKENAVRAIRSEVASLSVHVAEKILREKLSGEEQQSEMVNRLLDEVMLNPS